LRGSDRAARDSRAATLGMILRYLRAALTSRGDSASTKDAARRKKRTRPRDLFCTQRVATLSLGPHARGTRRSSHCPSRRRAGRTMDAIITIDYNSRLPSIMRDRLNKTREYWFASRDSILSERVLYAKIGIRAITNGKL